MRYSCVVAWRMEALTVSLVWLELTIPSNLIVTGLNKRGYPPLYRTIPFISIL